MIDDVLDVIWLGCARDFQKYVIGSIQFLISSKLEVPSPSPTANDTLRRLSREPCDQVSCVRTCSVGAQSAESVLSRRNRRCRLHTPRQIPPTFQCPPTRRPSIPPVRRTRISRTTYTQPARSHCSWHTQPQPLLFGWDRRCRCARLLGLWVSRGTFVRFSPTTIFSAQMTVRLRFCAKTDEEEVRFYPFQYRPNARTLLPWVHLESGW